MKRILIFALTIALIVSIASGCTSTATTTAATTTQAPVNTTQGSGTTSSDVKLEEEEIRLGMYMPLTGPTSQSGMAGFNAVQLGVEEINNAGGIYGSKVKLFYYDDKSQPEEATKAVTKLINVDKVHVMIGSLHSGHIQATGDLVEEAKIPELGPGTSPKWLQMGFTYLFRSLPSTAAAAPTLVGGMTTLGATKMGALIRQDEYGKASWADLKPMIEKAGIEIVVDEQFQPGDVDFTGQFAKIVKAGVDSVMLIGVTNDCGPLMKQLRQAGYKGYVYGTESFLAPEVREIAGDAANGLLFMTPYIVPDTVEDSITPIEKEFNQKYFDKYGALPATDVAYRCYDALQVLKEGILRAKSLDGTKIRDQISELNGFVGLGGTFDYRGNNGEGLLKSRVFITHQNKQWNLDDFLKDNPKDFYKP